MVFFTAMIIVIILYYLQVDGLIYCTIIALIAELINIFMAHTLTKSVEKRMKKHSRKLVDGYSKRLKTNRKTIQELERVQEESVKKLHNANLKIKEYEAKIEILEKTSESLREAQAAITAEQASLKAAKKERSKSPNPEHNFRDLPSGSNRRKLPIR